METGLWRFSSFIKLFCVSFIGQVKQRFHTGHRAVCVKFNPDDDKQTVFLSGMQVSERLSTVATAALFCRIKKSSNGTRERAKSSKNTIGILALSIRSHSLITIGCVKTFLQQTSFFLFTFAKANACYRQTRIFLALLLNVGRQINSHLGMVSTI